MAWRAGCRVANMEFNQFHPPVCITRAKGFLVSEALRGEGGLLRLPSGERFMQTFVTARSASRRGRAIDHEMKRIGADCLHLDVSHLEAKVFKSTSRTSSRAAAISASTSPASRSRLCRPPLHLRRHRR